MKRIGWLCLLLLLSGCQHNLIRHDDSLTATLKMATITPGMTLEDLMAFSARFQAHSAREQATLCHDIRPVVSGDGNPWSGWYLATAISLNGECGEPAEAIGLINRLLGKRFVAEEVRQFAAYQLSLLQQRQQQAQQLHKLSLEQQKLQERLNREDQVRRLLEKQLRDLKRIETSINQRLDEKQ
ncbi:hypothetical protein [Sedimenticola sp.]|uniref:hypothetical protein n=1 Tax=Sedimenticola sp. TaxID=1940285 RepID=UPI003D0F89E9